MGAIEEPSPGLDIRLRLVDELAESKHRVHLPGGTDLHLRDVRPPALNAALLCTVVREEGLQIREGGRRFHGALVAVARFDLRHRKAILAVRAAISPSWDRLVMIPSGSPASIQRLRRK
ncbi:MAG: hypothetical protein GY769_22900 [bacterium]|nr:hypothetical protein [bacterium]